MSWPLDGSAAAGTDLEGDASARMLTALLPSMGGLLELLGGPAAEESFKAH